MPTLADVLERLSGRAGVAIEIKNIPGSRASKPTGEPLVAVTHAEIERRGFDGPVLVISFNPRSIEASRSIAPDVPTGFLTTELVPTAGRARVRRQEGHEMVLPGDVLASLAAGDAFVEEAHAAGLRVGTWTVDDPDDACGRSLRSGVSTRSPRTTPRWRSPCSAGH